LLRFEHVKSVRHLRSVNSSHLVIFEGHSINLKYNRAQANAVLSEVYCSTSQHNSILLTCENLYVNIVRDIEISVGSVFALCSLHVVFARLISFFALEIICVDVVRLRPNLFSLALNFTCWSEIVYAALC